jgi:hypothetical protein
VPGSPAPASTIQASSRSSTRRRPHLHLQHQRCGSRVSTRLLPPPRMSLGARPSSGWLSTGARRPPSGCAPAWAPRRQAEGVVGAQARRPARSRGRRRRGAWQNFDRSHTAPPCPGPSPCPASTPSSNPISWKCATPSTRPTRKSAPASTSRAQRRPASTEGQGANSRLRRQTTSSSPRCATCCSAKLTKRGVDVRFLDLAAKPQKMGGDKLKQAVKVKAGIDAETWPRRSWSSADQGQQDEGAGQHPGRRGARHRRQARRPAGGDRAAAQGSADLPLGFNNFGCAAPRRRSCETASPSDTRSR